MPWRAVPSMRTGMNAGSVWQGSMTYFVVEVTDQEIRREKDKARELRRSRWWQTVISRRTCHWCGGDFPPEELTMDHVVPIVRGGKSSRGNVVPACKECNNRKKYLLPLEWEEYLEKARNGGEQ